MTKGYVVRGVHKGASVFSIGGGGDFAEQSEDGFDHPWPFDTLGGASAAVGDMDRSGCTDVRIFAVAEDGTETPLPSYEEALADLQRLRTAAEDVCCGFTEEGEVKGPLSLRINRLRVAHGAQKART